VGPRIPTTGVTTIPNSTVVSCSWSQYRDRLRSRRGATTSNDGFLAWCYEPFKRRIPQPRSASPLAIGCPSKLRSPDRLRRPDPAGASVGFLKRRREVIRQEAAWRSSVVPQPDGRPARPRSALRHPVLAMADRSIDQGLAMAHARRSVRRRLA
jgi:hypothetical protein